MSIEEFEDMTPAQFIITWAGYSSKRIDDEQRQWERVRALAIAISGCPEGKTINQAWPLPWDGEIQEQEQNISVEERAKRVEDILRGE